MIDIFSCRRNILRMSKGLQQPSSIMKQHLISYRSLKRELVRAQEEIKRIQSVPLVIGQFMEAIDQK
jgi:ATP-dependent 26S proteasome regulatory subunit